MKNETKEGGPIQDAPPKREFKTLIAAFLTMATVGTVVGGAEEAKAQILRPCGSQSFDDCLNPRAFFQFSEAGFDRITPSFGEQVGPGTPGTPGFVEFGDPKFPIRSPF